MQGSTAWAQQRCLEVAQQKKKAQPNSEARSSMMLLRGSDKQAVSWSLSELKSALATEVAAASGASSTAAATATAAAAAATAAATAASTTGVEGKCLRCLEHDRLHYDGRAHHQPHDSIGAQHKVQAVSLPHLEHRLLHIGLDLRMGRALSIARPLPLALVDAVRHCKGEELHGQDDGRRGHHTPTLALRHLERHLGDPDLCGLEGHLEHDHANQGHCESEL
mmetsp:Transcript_98293/g.316750  ORF Transcript_98293/g.316750 Transcript_98293/m.316750 type:complete len:222 (-) Transcript_98293:1294-1959(-)